MKKLLLVGVLLFSPIVVHTEDTTALIETAKREVEAYLDHFFTGRNHRYSKRAKRYAPYVARFAIQYDVDPLLIAVTISSESSWIPDVVGKFGEKGLGQVHGLAKTTYERETGQRLTADNPKNQIEATARWLQKCLIACDHDVAKAINRYRSGRCEFKGQSKRRYRRYLAAVALVRGEQ